MAQLATNSAQTKPIHPRKLDWVEIGLKIALLVGILGITVSGTEGFFDLGTGWQTAARLPFLSSIGTLSIASDGTPWILVHPGFSDRTELLTVSDTNKSAFTLPTTANPIPGLERASNFWHLASLTIDSFGRPWLALGQDGLVYWDGQQWRLFSATDGEFLRCVSAAYNNGGQILALTSQKCDSSYELIIIDPVNNTSQPLPLPALASQASLEIQSIKAAPDGKILVVTGSEHFTTFFVVENGVWQPEWVFLDLPIDTVRRNHVYLDSHGHIWATNVACNVSECSLREIGRYDPSIAQWHWETIPCSRCSGLDYGEFVVDTHDRIWIEGQDSQVNNGMGFNESRYMDVLQLSGHEEAVHIIRYSESNSNVELIGSLALGSDGRLWRGYRNALYIDTNASQLPGHLPEWFAATLTSDARLFLWIPIYGITTIALSIYKSRRNKSKPALSKPTL